MNIDFSKSGDQSGSEPVKQPIVEIETQTVSTPDGGTLECKNTYPAVMQPNGLLGAKQSALSEIVLPRLQLVHSVGVLKDSFDDGCFVHNQSLVLYEPPAINAKTQTVERAGSPPLVVTFLDLRPLRYFERVAGGGRGQICNSLQEVASAGGTVDWNEWKLKKDAGMKLFQYAVDCLLAIERPDAAADDDTTFVFPVDDRKYALCMYNMKGSAYTVLKKTVLTDQHIGCLRKGTATHSYALSARLEPTPDKSSTYWKPVLVPNKPASPAFIEFAKSVLLAPTVETPDVE